MTTDGKSLGQVVDVRASAARSVAGVALEAVEWTGGYWRERLLQSEEVTVRTLWERLADPEAGHVLENFRIAAGLCQGEPQGTWWQDEWLYKWIEAASCLWRLRRDPWLRERMDDGIALIAAAQAQDGYIWTHLARPGMERFQFIFHHEVYVMGHLLTAAVIHRRMTQDSSLLDVALRTGDFLCRTLGHTVAPCFAHNPSAIMGLVELFRETGEARYLDCARLIVDARGSEPAPRGRDLWYQRDGMEGTDQIQDRVPLRDATEVVGHNVFFTYLFAGAADVLLETGDESLKVALDRMWDDLAERKMSVNGGVSPMGHGLSIHHDRVVEAVGPAFFLPQEDAYNETCGQVGAMMWAQRMLLHSPQARYAELAEHEMYNGILPGIGLDGETFWYRNPLRRSTPGGAGRGLNDLAARELPGRKRICCPTNVLRSVVQWQSYAWSVDCEGAWLHQYGQSLAKLDLGNGDELVVEQETDYPWDGAIRLHLRAVPAAPMALRLRIPEWATGCSLRVNGAPAEAPAQPGTYAVLTRQWDSGDTVELDLPMPVRLVEADPRAEQCRNQVAVFRGPVLYCLESVDLPDGVELADVYVPGDVQLRPVAVDQQPFGLMALEGSLLARSAPRWEGHLYRTVSAPCFVPVRVRLVPYQAWANRGPAAMSVWLPVAWCESGSDAACGAPQGEPGLP
jgi:DUF1680 family protein